MGIEPGRVKLVWASAAEGVRLAKEITTLVEEIRALGPLNWPERVQRIGAGFGNGAGLPEVAEEVAA
jgi:hypothetical protein